MSMKHAENIQRFYDDVQMPGGYTHNLADRLKTNELYYIGRFKTGQYDKRGFRKFFLNVIHVACDIARKFMDLDTRDFLRLIPERDGDEWTVWLMTRQLKYWMKTTGFNRFLNELPTDFLKHGHVVLKAVNGEVKIVSLLNLRVDPRAKWLKSMKCFYEIHEWSRSEVEAVATADGLRQLDASHQSEDDYDDSYIVYESYTKTGKTWKRQYLAEVFCYTENGGTQHGTEAQLNDGKDYLPPVVLKEEEVTKLPYYEEKFEHVPGRWLGFGLVEYLEDNQIAINETDYLERKALHFKALQLWFTQDEALAGQNAIVDAENGDYVHTMDTPKPLAKDNADLSAYNNTRNVWKQNTDQKAFTSEFVSNGTLPSRTPIGVVNVQAQFATAFFSLKQESLAILVKQVLEEVVIPKFLKDTAGEHVQVFMGSDKELGYVHNAIIRAKVNEMQNRYIERTGYAPSQIVTDDFKLQLQKKLNESTELFIKIPESMYENAKYAVSVEPTDEAIDIGAKTQVLSTALQIKNANPMIDQDPMGKAILMKFLSLGGVSPVDFEMMTASQKAVPAPAPQMVPGGSISPMMSPIGQ